MEGGERSAHNDTPVLIERTGASSAQTRSSGARREAGIVCMLFQPLSPTIPSPDADPDPMFRWTGSLGPIT